MSEDSAAAPAGSARAGFVAVVGRPNVGKSTLTNRLVGQKVAIVSSKPQTTRNRILAVLNRAGGQIVLFDTPGIHKPVHRMNRQMVAAAESSLSQVDVVAWIIDASEAAGPGDRYIQRRLAQADRPVVLGVNKIDKISRPEILPVIDRYRRLLDFADIVPLSALQGDGVELLGERLLTHLPEGEPLYPEDFVSDLPERFFVAEMIREAILERTRDEIPYSTGVVVDSFKEAGEEGLVRIEASVLVERDSQKAIVIGRGGRMLKAIGTRARREIEAFLDARLYLGLTVKVRESWRENPRILERMGLGGSRGRR
jgi:GTP-binding protein Era